MFGELARSFRAIRGAKFPKIWKMRRDLLGIRNRPKFRGKRRVTKKEIKKLFAFPISILSIILDFKQKNVKT